MRKSMMFGILGMVGATATMAACGTSDNSGGSQCPQAGGANDLAGSGGPSTTPGQTEGGQGTSGSGDSAGGDSAGGASSNGLPTGTVPALPDGFQASNLPSDLGVDVSEDLIFNGDTCASEARIDTDKGEITCFDPGMVQQHPTFVFKVAKQDDGSEVAVFAGKNIVIAPTVRVVVEGQRPLLLLAPGDVTIAGTLQAIPDAIYSAQANAGGFSSQKGEQVKGLGPGGGSGTSTSAGGGAFCGKGGAGGGATGAAGGVVYGTPELIPLLGGSSGGNGALGGEGGAGGGAVQIVAGGSLSVTATGVIHVGGAGGGWNGGGGGSGGAILLEAHELHIAGTLAANGGGGGEAGANGESGLRASADATAAPGGSLGTAATDNDGGDGSAADALDGSNGSTASGGGGGGAGRIRLNSASGDADVTGVLSPAAASACVSQRKLGS